MKKTRRRINLKVTNGSPVVQSLFKIAREANMTQKELAEKTGIVATTLKSWRMRNQPRITDLEAALNALGYELKVVNLPEAADARD